MANIGQLAANRRMANTRSVDTNQITGYMGTHHHISSQSPLIYRILDGFPCFPVESPYYQSTTRVPSGNWTLLAVEFSSILYDNHRVDGELMAIDGNWWQLFIALWC